ncbi:hypothetical protein [Novosphingobium arvoryzae]|nr:hypothetical protein [Novosphingobium arvoryzae]
MSSTTEALAYPFQGFCPSFRAISINGNIIIIKQKDKDIALKIAK